MLTSFERALIRPYWLSVAVFAIVGSGSIDAAADRTFSVDIAQQPDNPRPNDRVRLRCSWSIPVPSLSVVSDCRMTWYFTGHSGSATSLTDGGAGGRRHDNAEISRQQQLTTHTAADSSHQSAGSARSRRRRRRQEQRHHQLADVVDEVVSSTSTWTVARLTSSEVGLYECRLVCHGAQSAVVGRASMHVDMHNETKAEYAARINTMIAAVLFATVMSVVVVCVVVKVVCHNCCCNRLLDHDCKAAAADFAGSSAVAQQLRVVGPRPIDIDDGNVFNIAAISSSSSPDRRIGAVAATTLSAYAASRNDDDTDNDDDETKSDRYVDTTTAQDDNDDGYDDADDDDDFNHVTDVCRSVSSSSSSSASTAARTSPRSPTTRSTALPTSTTARPPAVGERRGSGSGFGGAASGSPSTLRVDDQSEAAATVMLQDRRYADGRRPSKTESVSPPHRAMTRTPNLVPVSSPIVPGYQPPPMRLGSASTAAGSWNGNDVGSDDGGGGTAFGVGRIRNGAGGGRSRRLSDGGQFF